MNLRKAIFVFGGGSLIIIILAFKFGVFGMIKDAFSKDDEPVEMIDVSIPKEPAPAPAVAPAPAPAVAPAPVVTAPAVIAEEVKSAEPQEIHELGEGNPFNYGSAGGNGYSPMMGSQQVGQIVIKGIISIKGKNPIAILHLNDTDKVYYVSKGDVIRINTQSQTGTLVTESYIVVQDIRADEVELIQQERPDKVIILR